MAADVVCILFVKTGKPRRGKEGGEEEEKTCLNPGHLLLPLSPRQAGCAGLVAECVDVHGRYGLE